VTGTHTIIRSPGNLQTSPGGIHARFDAESRGGRRTVAKILIGEGITGRAARPASSRDKECRVQEQGRTEILSDYHLRVGQVTADTAPPPGYRLHEQRLDETVAGAGTTVTLVTAKRPNHLPETANAKECAAFLGLNPDAAGLLAWDVFDAVLTPGDLILMMSWRDRAAAEGFENTVALKNGARLRRIRIVRDYGMFDRREAPQYYPDAQGRESVHS
jgi:hypothetical protein